MEKGILGFHELLRWALLALLVINIFRNLIPTMKNYRSEEKNWVRWLLLVSGANFLTIIYIYLYGKYGLLILKDQGYSIMDVFQLTYLRFWLIEYPIMMLISIGCIVFAYKISIRSTLCTSKYRKVSKLYILALLFIITAIPWKFRNTEITSFSAPIATESQTK